MRFWRVEAIRDYLSRVRTDWVWDEQFSGPRTDVWLRRADEGGYRSAQLDFYPAQANRPAVTPEQALVNFCRQLDVDFRMFAEGIGPEGWYSGPLDHIS